MMRAAIAAFTPSMCCRVRSKNTLSSSSPFHTLLQSSCCTMCSSSSSFTKIKNTPRLMSSQSTSKPPLQYHQVSYDHIPKSNMGPYKEFSVIYTNRALNLMSEPFKQVMMDLNGLLKAVYGAKKVAVVPGSGTFGMEAVARQFATNEDVIVIRNGWFSYRWTEIMDMGGIPKSHTDLKAVPFWRSWSSIPGLSTHSHPKSLLQYAPCPVDTVIETIQRTCPAVVFAPHVDTSTGIQLTKGYIRKVADAVKDVGGLFVLDCIASGMIWVDMRELGVDVLISAPQKGWTGPSCAGLVMMSERAVTKMQETNATSFSLSLKKWSGIMDNYENGDFGYHTTLPTDALRDFHEVTVEAMQFGFPELKIAQQALGDQARELLESRGLMSVAAPGFQAPGVLVYYSPTGIDNHVLVNKFKRHGLQIAMGVPWKIDEMEGLHTFRIGLFGIDKMRNISNTIHVLEGTLDKVLEECAHVIPSSEDINIS